MTDEELEGEDWKGEKEIDPIKNMLKFLTSPDYAKVLLQNAKWLRKGYLALVDQGFSEEQAMKIICERGSAL